MSPHWSHFAVKVIRTLLKKECGTGIANVTEEIHVPSRRID